MRFCFTEQAVPATGIDPTPSAICQNGLVFLGYGSAEFIGLGFSVLVALVFIEVCTASSLFGLVLCRASQLLLACRYPCRTIYTPSSDFRQHFHEELQRDYCPTCRVSQSNLL